MAIYAKPSGLKKPLSNGTEESAAVISLRSKVKDRQEELARLQSELAAVKTRAATTTNDTSAQDTSAEEREAKERRRKLMAMWDSGELYSKEVNKTVVDVKGDVKGASANFKKTQQAAWKPTPKPAAPTAAARAPLPEETVYKPPSWAFAEKPKVIQKENAKSSIGDNVNIESLKTSVTTSTGSDAVHKEWVGADKTRSAGGVSSLLSKFNSPSDAKFVVDTSTPGSDPSAMTFAEKWPSGEPGPKFLERYLHDLIEDLDQQIEATQAEIATLKAAA